MMTLQQFSAEPSTISTITSWYLADLSKAQGKQELFTHKSPQKLELLREHALIESTISSNRIEGVNVDQSRINTLILGKPFLKDRDEEDVRGYRDALAKKGVIKRVIRRIAQTPDEKTYVEVPFIEYFMEICNPFVLHNHTIV